MRRPPAGETATSLPVHPCPPIEYAPRYVSEKILTCQSPLEGEPKHVTGLLSDLKRAVELIASYSG